MRSKDAQKQLARTPLSVFSRTSPSADFERLRTSSGIFGNDRIVYKNSEHSQDKNLTPTSQKRLAGIGVASVISRPATCQVLIAGEHFCLCQWKSRYVENCCLAHALDIRFDFPLRRRYMLCLSRSPSLGACNSHNKPMQRHFYRTVYF